ncbi:hypothetical protein BN1048_01796 [Jeotgalicoccus saudimassiliensis]|uniref:ABC-2 family transporter protein n=1 Tax=Jeotgalicoccus saudimassiliensis TaxID=1461582 RepID=A0A078M5H7_9STAP|nr:hypothetical protein [Jeotgalicoccus saudimassiliensis]CEA02658.1 hypothetical protein BN1048_01796 [Jeotgalicoccus saudimassiliensis]
MNTHKIRATIYRDIREFFTNYAVLTLLVMPPAMALLYGGTAQKSGAEMPEIMIFVVLGTTLSAVTTNIPLMLYAEENEHGLLKLVMHTRSDLVNGMLGRSIVTLLITAAVTTVSLVIMNGTGIFSLPLFAGLILAAIIFLNLGLWTGLYAKLQSTSTVYGVIILFFLGMTPIAETLNVKEDSIIIVIAELTPVYQLIAIHNNAGIMPYVILLLWLGLTMFLVRMAVSKRTETL